MKRHLIPIAVIVVLSLAITILSCYIAFKEGEFYEYGEGPGVRDCQVLWDQFLWFGSFYFAFFATAGGLLYGCSAFVYFVVGRKKMRNNKN